jgi:hypothetical protein
VYSYPLISPLIASGARAAVMVSTPSLMLNGSTELVGA